MKERPVWKERPLWQITPACSKVNRRDADNNAALFCFVAVPVVAILSAIPWLLPWKEINVPYLPTFHVVSSVAPWIGSTLYHLFMNHNTGYIAYKVLLTIDILGIWVTQTAGKQKRPLCIDHEWKLISYLLLQAVWLPFVPQFIAWARRLRPKSWLFTAFSVSIACTRYHNIAAIRLAFITTAFLLSSQAVTAKCVWGRRFR